MKNAKTTFAGLAIAALNMYANGVHPKQIGMSVAMALLGVWAQDAPKPAAATTTSDPAAK